MQWNEEWQKAAEILKAGEVAVIPTDTLYGIVALTGSSKAVERVYFLRKRSPDKPVIILIGSYSQLEDFVDIPDTSEKYLQSVWPGQISVILPCNKKEYAYLHRGTNSLAFRMPADEALQKLLLSTGPLIAPSANIEGMPSATNIEEAKKYFGENVSVYIDKGELIGNPSRLVRLNEDGSVDILR